MFQLKQIRQNLRSAKQTYFGWFLMAYQMIFHFIGSWCVSTSNISCLKSTAPFRGLPERTQRRCHTSSCRRLPSCLGICSVVPQILEFPWIPNSWMVMICYDGWVHGKSHKMTWMLQGYGMTAAGREARLDQLVWIKDQGLVPPEWEYKWCRTPVQHICFRSHGVHPLNHPHSFGWCSLK